MSDKFLKIIAGGFTVGLIGLLKVCTKNIDSIGHSVARNSTEMVEHGAPRAIRIAGREYAQDDESNTYSEDVSTSAYSAPSDVRDETTYKNYLRRLGRVSFELGEMESTNAQVSLDVEDYYEKILAYQFSKNGSDIHLVAKEFGVLCADTTDKELQAGAQYQLRLIRVTQFLYNQSDKTLDPIIEERLKEWKENISSIKELESINKLKYENKKELNEAKKELNEAKNNINSMETTFINEWCFSSYYPFHKQVVDSIFARNHLK
jgi:uncharacterized protein YwgA